MPESNNERIASDEVREDKELGSRKERAKYDVIDALRNANYISVLFGWLAAVGVAIILALVLAGFFAAGPDENFSQASRESWQRAGVVGTMFLSFLAGGYVAGRMAGSSGIKHGVLVPLFSLVLTLTLLLFGLVVGVSLTDNLSGSTLPRVPDELQQSLDTIFSASGILAMVFAPFVGGIFGGAWGARTSNAKPDHESGDRQD